MCFRQKETGRSSVEEKDSGGRYEKESHAYFDTKNGCRSFCLAIILTVVCPLTAFAAETEQKAVRVGFYRCPFNIKDETGHMSGYGYDYQKDIAVYTGWKYEYVEASWPELLQMLKDGEIDLLSDVSYTPERETEMLEKGELDAVVAVDSYPFENTVPMVQIGGSDFYFAINSARPDLKTELDEAMHLLLNTNRYYTKGCIGNT